VWDELQQSVGIMRRWVTAVKPAVAVVVPEQIVIEG
jgi:hypothetical protein